MFNTQSLNVHTSTESHHFSEASIDVCTVYIINLRASVYNLSDVEGRLILGNPNLYIVPALWAYYSDVITSTLYILHVFDRL